MAVRKVTDTNTRFELANGFDSDLNTLRINGEEYSGFRAAAGIQGEKGEPGQDGAPGVDGVNGVGINTIRQDTDTTMTIVLTDTREIVIALPQADNSLLVRGTTVVTLDSAVITSPTQYTVTASIDNTPLLDTYIRLSNDFTIHIPPQQTTGSVVVPLSQDDTTDTLSIKSVTGAFENLDTTSTLAKPDTARIIISDIVTVAPISITSPQRFTFTVTSTQPAVDTITVSLTGGNTIQITAGETTATQTFNNYDHLDKVSITNVEADSQLVAYSDEEFTLRGAIVAELRTFKPSTLYANSGQTYDVILETSQASTINTRYTLSTGEVIQILAGQTEGSVTRTSPNIYRMVTASNTETITVSATTTDPDLSDGSVTFIQDSVSIEYKAFADVRLRAFTPDVPLVSAGLSLAEQDPRSRAFYANIFGNDGTGSNLVTASEMIFTLSDGKVVTIPAGRNNSTTSFLFTPGTYNYTDLTVTGGVSSIRLLDQPSTITIDEYNTVVTLEQVTVGKVVATYDYTIRVNLSNRSYQSGTVVTLNTGDVITIPVGETSGEITLTAPSVAQVLTFSITSVTGGNFDNITHTDTLDVNVEHHVGRFTLSAVLPSTTVPDVAFTLNVDIAPYRDDATVIFQDGREVVIPVGQTSVDFTVTVPDVTTEHSVSITNVQDGYTGFITDGNSTITIVPESTVTLTSDDTTAQLFSSYTVTVTVDNAPSSDLTVTLNTGDTITIPSGQLTSTRSVTATSTGTVSHSIASATGGNFLTLSTAGEFDIDVIHTGVVTITTPPTVLVGREYTVTAEVSTRTLTSLEIVLNTGDTITIPAGQSTGSTSVTASNTVQDFTHSISSTTGGGYTNLDTTSTATIAVEPYTGHITLSTISLVPPSQSYDVTAEIDNPPLNDLVVSLSIGGTITIPAGQTSGVSTLTSPSVEQNISIRAIAVSSEDGYSSITYGPSVIVRVVSFTHTLTLEHTSDPRPVGDRVQIQVSVNPTLSQNITITLDSGETGVIVSGTTTGFINVTPTNIGTTTYSIASVTEIEDVVFNTSSTVDVQATERNGILTLGVSPLEPLVDVFHRILVNVDVYPTSDLTVNLSNGGTATIPRNRPSGQAFIRAPLTPGDTTVSIVSVSGGGYTNLDISDTITYTLIERPLVVEISGPATVTPGEIFDINIALFDDEGNPETTDNLIVRVQTGEDFEDLQMLNGQSTGSLEFQIPQDAQVGDTFTYIIGGLYGDPARYSPKTTTSTHTVTIVDS